MRILMVSDYTPVIGGLERVVSTTVGLLSNMGHDVVLRGWDISTARWHARARRFGVILSHANLFAAQGLDKAIQSHRPDVIWLHSVSRWLGPRGLLPLRHFDGFVWKTYHDFGYVHPFASRVCNINDIPPFSARGFIDAAGKKQYERYYARYKFRKMAEMRHILIQTCNRHIVPSPFFADVLRTSWGLSHVDVVPHCVM